MIVVATSPIERFGVRHVRNLVIIGEDGPMSVALCLLATNGRLREIFSGFNSFHDQLSLSPEAVETFAREHESSLLPEGHATLILRRLSRGRYDVVRLESEQDGRGADSFAFSLEEKFVWRAGHTHQIVVPAGMFFS